MLFVYILRFITGFVKFRAGGGFSERFVNLCNLSGIPLWDITYDGDNVFACTTIDGYKKIISCARKSGMTTKSLKRVGLPFIIFRFRSRSGLAIGLALMMLTLSILSGRIWIIDVTGNEIVPDEEIIAAVNDAGIRIGSKRSSFNAAQCAITAESEFDEVSRISINIKGSGAHITVNESPQKPEITDDSGYYNVVSAADSQLVILETYSGTAQAKLFNPVLKGQTLISGINSNKDESVSYVHAHGYAVGRTEKEIASGTDIHTKSYDIKTIKKVYSLFFLGKKITLGRSPESYDYEFESEKYLSLKSKRMPFGIFCTEYSTVEESDAELSENTARLMSIESFANQGAEYTAPRQIISIETNEEKNASSLGIKGKFICFENIGKEQPFEVTETE